MRALIGMNAMNRGLAGFLFVLAIATTAEAQQLIERRRALARDAAVRVHMLSGTVRVIGWDKDSIAVSGVTPKGQEFHMGGTDRGVKMGIWEETDGDAPSRLELHVPTHSRVWVKTGYSAEVEVSGVSGSLDLNIVGGTIRVSGSPREVSAEAMDGDIEIVASPRWLRAKTASGAITVRGSPEDVGLSTVSGTIRLAGKAVERGRFESVTGDIHFVGAPTRKGALDFDSHGGTVELRLPADLDADVHVVSLNGAIQNGLNDRRPIRGGPRGGTELAFSAGDGSARIAIRSFKGLVALRRR